MNKNAGSTDIKYLKGIGEVLGKLLANEMEIKTFRDLAYYFPIRHIDKSRYFRIAEFAGEMSYVMVRGRFLRFAHEGEGARRRLIALFSDGYSTMEVVWFSRTAQIERTYQPGVEYTLFGKPNRFRNTWSMVHPEVDVYKDGVTGEPHSPIYSIPERARKRGVTMRSIRRWVHNLMEHRDMQNCTETLPAEMIAGLHLMPLRQALINMHFPTSPEDLQQARRRFKIEELYYVELHILRYARDRIAHIQGQALPRVGETFNTFYRKIVPFPLTNAQKSVLRQIHADMSTGMQMNRLLQGDVGSGKTLVAFMTMLLAVDNGTQACLMAPTEILATQHYETLHEWCKKLGLNIALLKGSTRRKERQFIDEALTDGTINILVGTHALIEEHVKFRNLGVAIIDEQHRFGVAQRARLWSKSATAPHILVMTATPIPRTLAMTVYGDLSVSVIDELPPGRKPVRTLMLTERNKEDAWRLIRQQLRLGRQAYIVYPLINENEKADLHSLEEGYEGVMGIFGKDYKVAYVHGRMKPNEKEYQMQRFVSGDARILVATTVIEVGVNVPNATVMMIENAERFGLSQLHQLRGRVGRGADCSYCILMARDKMSENSHRRLELMTQTSDGFEIAEADMKMRGPGDLEGTMQSGLPFSLNVASLAHDGILLELARRCAIRYLDKYPELSRGGIPANSEASMMVRELSLRFSGGYDWSHIS